MITPFFIPRKRGRSFAGGPQGVEAKFGVRPDQIIDMLALMGDSADNVPGVAGIGEKGAAKLLQNYETLDGIYENIEAITNKRQRNGLENNRENAFLSQELVTIKTDIELPYQLEDLACSPAEAVANEELLSLTAELELRSLNKRVQTGIDALSEGHGSKR